MAIHRQPIGLGPREVLRTDPARVRKVARTARRKPRTAAVSPMRFYGTLAGLFVLSAAAVGIGASVESPRSFMAGQDYVQARKMIEAEWRLALAQCRALEETRRSQCRALARADDQVRKAELEVRYLGTVNAQSDARAAKARREALAYLKL